MRADLIALALVVSAATAQTTSPSASQDDSNPGSISGIVTDDAGSPIAEASIRASGMDVRQRKGTTTDAEGRYELSELSAGRYSISVYQRREPYGSAKTVVSLAPGQDLASVDIRLPTGGEITGRVLDHNGEPLPGTRVYLVGSEYQHGGLQHKFRDSAEADDRGEYRLWHSVKPAVAYAVLARPGVFELPAISDVPADPELRRPVHRPTYYPEAPSIDGAERLVLRGGEVREGVDIQMLRSPSHCIEGVLAAAGAPAVTHFRIEEREAGYGTYNDGGMYGQMPSGTTGPDGRIRICDLHPGEYKLTTSSPLDTTTGFVFSTTNIAITREDARNLSISALPLLPLSGEIVWHDVPPEEPVESQPRVWLQSVYRATWPIEREGRDPRVSIPGEFSFPGLLMDEYHVRVLGLPSGIYVKDITYGGASILHGPLKLGSAIGDARLRITVAHDAAFLHVRVADEEGNPVAHVNVFVIPNDVAGEADLAAKAVSGETDQYGVYVSSALAPGKYSVLAADLRLEPDPETIGKLWRARPKASVIELGPGATEQVTIEPMAMN